MDYKIVSQILVIKQDVGQLHAPVKHLEKTRSTIKNREKCLRTSIKLRNSINIFFLDIKRFSPEEKQAERSHSIYWQGSGTGSQQGSSTTKALSKVLTENNIRAADR